MKKKLSIIIPAYNEGRTIRKILESIISVKYDYPVESGIIIIDDASTDDTIQKAEEFCLNYPEANVTILNQTINQGKGAAIRIGFEHAEGDYIVIQDADLEYDPREYNALLKPLEEDVADVVYGSRFMGNNPHRILFFWHSIGNKFLTFLSNAFTNLNLTDMETCFKMFRASVIKDINLKENRFGIEPEITAKVARIPGIRIYEVGISYYGRTYEDGKKINWRDGMKAVYCILKYNIWSLK
ncbi:glycosyltransferase family 2 protein [Marinilabilia sp.]|uniref:glycosyltransferase family 2 protein n=1 Tax=Marinilabilia sp. TaxID=2021252 RepID=UPI0025C1057D|nr:glycosyltransferase family 2 protein [Marinilabilia sp.]